MKSRFVEFPSAGQVVVREEEIDGSPLVENEVIVRNLVSLVSAGTELAGLTGTEYNAKFPLRPGYAAIGEIIAKHDSVDDFAVGDRVFYAGKHASIQRFRHRQGHQWGTLYRAPADLDPEEAVFVCLAEIAYAGVVATDPEVNDWVAVFGLGLIGNLTAQLYALKGARVIGLDPVESRVQVAHTVGIETTLSVPGSEQVEAIKTLTNGQRARVTVDAVGHSAVVVTAAHAAADFGEVVLLGSPRVPYNADLTDLLADVHMRGLILRGAHQWRIPATNARGIRHSVESAVESLFDLIRRRQLKVRELLSHKIQVDEAPEIYAKLQSSPETTWGVIIDWRSE
jgi:2-desacetyl-2-hydroxyethyl bacteriochlorophyllide A dehydrogenase